MKNSIIIVSILLAGYTNCALSAVKENMATQLNLNKGSGIMMQATTPKASSSHWPNDAQLVISISMQFEAGGQPEGAESPFSGSPLPAALQKASPITVSLGEDECRKIISVRLKNF